MVAKQRNFKRKKKTGIKTKKSEAGKCKYKSGGAITSIVTLNKEVIAFFKFIVCFGFG